MLLKRTVKAAMACAAVICLCCAGVGNMYVQRHGSEGWLFFVFSQKLPAVKGNVLAKNIEYDYTYLESTDSVTLLATLRTNLAQKPVYSVIDFCDTSYKAPAELIYASPKGKGFVYRIKTVMPFGIWERMYACSEPFVVSYEFSSDSVSMVKCSFGYSLGKWKDNRVKMASIIETVKFNTGKK